MIQSTGGDVLTIGNKHTMDLLKIKMTYVAIYQFACFHGHKITVSIITTTRHEDYEISQQSRHKPNHSNITE